MTDLILSLCFRKLIHGFLLHLYSSSLQITGLFWDRDSCRPHWAWTHYVVWPCFSLLLTGYDVTFWVFEWQVCAIGSIAQRSFCPQMSRETRNVKHTGLSFQWERWNTHSSTQKAGNWKWLTAWWFVLGQTILQPGLEVASNLNDLFSQGLSQAPITRTRGG